MNASSAELCLVGAALGFPGAAADVVAEVADADIHDPALRRILGAVRAMVDTGEAVDPITVGHRLERAGQLEAVGGLDVLAELPDYVTTPDHVETWGRIVRDAAVGRRLAAACRETLAAVERPEGAAAALDGLERRLVELATRGAVRQVGTAADAAREALDRMRQVELHGSDALGVSWGLHDVDRLVRLEPGSLFFLAARPSMGKTALAVQVVDSVAQHHGPVLFVSLEMPRRDLATRATAARANLDLAAIRHGKLTPEQRQRAEDTLRQFSALPIVIDDRAGLGLGGIRAQARRMARGDGLALVVVDYLQLLAGEDAETRNLQVAAMSRGLKLLAMELDVPVLALSQLSRAVEARADRRPMLSDLRDSGSLEQDADVVVFVYRPEYYLTEQEAREKGVAGAAELIVAKNRNGPTGSAFVHFSKTATRFLPIERRWAS